MDALAPIVDVELKHFHLFCGLGGGAAGFNRSTARVGRLRAVMRCIGGIDSDPAAVRDFGRLAGVPATLRDLFDEGQYRDFHGGAPPPGWREATPGDIRAATGGEFPDIVFLSPPCKGFSGLLSQARSGMAKYQALNRLTLRGIWLMLEAFRDDPPAFVLLENVPRIATRGRPLVDRILRLLAAYDYAAAETVHDCGRLGGLAQSRKRFLLVARHRGKVPPFLYEPPQRPLRGVGEVLGRLPLPGDPAGGPMHRVPALQWQTWVRLAFVQAGKDWRSLQRLRVEDGRLADYLIVPEMRNGVLGVHGWEQPSGVVPGENRPTNGAYSVADPRAPAGAEQFGQYGVRTWDQPGATVTSQRSPGQGPFSVADPRATWSADAHRSKLRVQPWAAPAGTVTGSQQVGSGAPSVADPRLSGPHHNNVFRVVPVKQAECDQERGTTTRPSCEAVSRSRPRYRLLQTPELGQATVQIILNSAT